MASKLRFLNTIWGRVYPHTLLPPELIEKVLIDFVGEGGDNVKNIATCRLVCSAWYESSTLGIRSPFRG